MKAIKIFLLAMILTSDIYAQDKVPDQKLKFGKYNTNNKSHTNPFHYQELVLNNDSTFDYFVQQNEFLRFRKKGRWMIKKDTLIMDEFNPEFDQIMAVNESHDSSIPKGYLQFNVFEYDNNQFKYNINVSNNDTTLFFRFLDNPSMIHMQAVKSFSVSSAEYEYPLYILKDSCSNAFLIKVAPRPSFVKEKWLIKDFNIIPRGTNGRLVSYYLTLTP